jgi:hypothetical protein
VAQEEQRIGLDGWSSTTGWLLAVAGGMLPFLADIGSISADRMASVAKVGGMAAVLHKERKRS